MLRTTWIQPHYSHCDITVTMFTLSLSLLSPVSFCLSFFVLCLLPAQTTENDNIPLRLNMLNPWSWAHASSHQEPCLRPCRPCRPHSQTLARPENTRNGGHGVPRCWRSNGLIVADGSARFTAFCPVACAHLFTYALNSKLDLEIPMLTQGQSCKAYCMSDSACFEEGYIYLNSQCR